MRVVNDARVSEVRMHFAELAAAPATTCLALASYLDRRPLRYFSEEVRREFGTWMAQPDRMSAVTAEFRAEEAHINRGLRTLDEINAQEWHEVLENREPEQMVLLDRFIHPAYLRLTEGVLFSFLFGAAKASRVLRGKSVQGLDVFNVIEELKDRGLSLTCSVYDNVLRNAIAHGAIDYEAHSINYIDRSGSREFSFRETIRAADDLLDACNGLALALKLFFSTSIASTTNWPREVLLQELQSATSTPWWTIRACLVSEPTTASQLNVYAESQSRDNRKILYSAIQTGVLAERLAPGHSRYFVSIRGAGNQLGWTVLDGAKLALLRQQGANDISQFVPALEKDLGFFLFRRGIPGALTYIDTLITSLRVTAPYARRAYYRSLGRPDVFVRDVESHTDPYLVRKGWVVVPSPSVRAIRDHCNFILRRVAAEVRHRNRLRSLRPLGVAIVSVFASDLRLRRLKSYGLGPDLVCTLSQYGDRRKKIIDIFGSRVEVHKNVRIAWNANWTGLRDHLLR